MSAPDTEFTTRLNSYTESQFQRYLNWYGQNAKQAKNNLIAGLVVMVISSLFLVFFPGPMDDMSFLQYTFDPTKAIKLGLLLSILLSGVSIYTSSKQMKCYLSTEALLRSEYAKFNARSSDNAGPNDEAAFRSFVSGVDEIMAAQNPEVVIAVARDNDQTRNQPDAPAA